MTPIIRNKEDRERVRKWLEQRASECQFAADRNHTVRTYSTMQQGGHLFAVGAIESLCGPSPKRKAKR